MPTYDYECNACGHQMELFQKITDSPVRKCPSCGKNKLNRLFGTGAAIVFKGSGFYQTDYRSEGYRKSAESDKKAGESPASSGSDSSSTKASSPASSDKAAAKPAAESPAARPSKGKRKSGES